MGYTIVWQFDVKPDATSAFEAAYGARGDWASLFARGDGYLGTELHRDLEVVHRYIVIDRWRTEHDFRAFREHHARDYEVLDARCEALTVHEVRLGHYEPV